MRTRIAVFEGHYPWIDADGLAYFRTRIGHGGRDGEAALALEQTWARTREQQGRAVAALHFRCDVSGRCRPRWSVEVQDDGAVAAAATSPGALRPPLQ